MIKLNNFIKKEYKATTAPIEDGATADAVRRMYEDDREESGLLEE